MKRPQDSSWVFSLLSEKFFTPCLLHESLKKNEQNVFCLDCCSSICFNCLSLHTSHHLLQVRRYVYHDVIRLEDVEKMFDCGFIQPYTTNGAKVIFLRQRPQTQPLKSSESGCSTCFRTLQSPFHFCSLSCKVKYPMQYDGCISRYLYNDKDMPVSNGGPHPAIEDSQITPISVLDDWISFRTSSDSSTVDNIGFRNEWCTATTEHVYRKKRTSTYYIFSSLNALRQPRKRKGHPQRSPLF